MTKTDENLKAAFAGESQANRMYLAFAKKAEEEGFPQIAKLFKAAAEAETVHALNHLKVMGQVKSTTDNLGHSRILAKHTSSKKCTQNSSLKQRKKETKTLK